MDLIKIAEQAFAQENAIEIPSFNTGDTISVHYKIKEGNKDVFRFSKVLLSKLRVRERPKPLRLEKCPVTLE